MNIHEYQAKEILRQHGVATPRGHPCFSVDDAIAAAHQLGGNRWVVKAQVHAGARAKAGGVKVAHGVDEVRDHASNLLGSTLTTQQTGSQGRVVKRLLIEEVADIRQELYLGMLVDPDSERVVLMACGEGGIDIDDAASSAPDKLLKLQVDPVSGIDDREADDIARRIGVPERCVPQARAVMQKLYRAFDARDATLAEINPLVLTGDDRVLALDARFSVDDNALFRQPEIAAMRDPDQEDAAELEASALGLDYVSLDGDIGCLCNGAGLAMATIDAIKLHGGSPADFLDVGDATSEGVAQALKPMLRNPDLKAVLVNIHAGIAKCDVIAAGIVSAATQVGGLHIAVVVRMKGTHERRGKKILEHSGLPIVHANDMAQAVAMVVAAAKAP
jgi:succinyl-CoA synthetase beta subunit